MHGGAPLRFTLEGRAVVNRACRLGHPASIPCAGKNGQPAAEPSSLFWGLATPSSVKTKPLAQPAVSPSFRALLVQDG